MGIMEFSTEAAIYGLGINWWLVGNKAEDKKRGTTVDTKKPCMQLASVYQNTRIAYEL